MNPSDFVAQFDSATAMMRAVAHSLEDRPFPAVGASGPTRAHALVPVGEAISHLPRRLRQLAYITAGWYEANRPAKLTQFRSEEIARWAAGHYEADTYQHVAIGATNGALTHLWAALGAAFLPQTFLVPVRRRHHDLDDYVASMHWGLEPGEAFLRDNPDIDLHHMHDPVQDRLMIRRMAYFRFKWRRLPMAYRTFLRHRVPPGATIWVVECGQTWPATQVAPRHWFQAGAVGAFGAEDYLEKSPEIREYVARHQGPKGSWRVPAPTDRIPEAEWGFQPELLHDLEEVADAHGYHLRRVRFDAPQDPAAPIADLFRWWFDRRAVARDRLLVSSFIAMNPWLSMRAGLVPFWCVFNKTPSADALERYLAQAEPFDEILAMPFSNGVHGEDVISRERWEQLFARARRGGRFVGVDPERYPADFASFVRHYVDLRRVVSERYPTQRRLTREELEEALAAIDTRGVDFGRPSAVAVSEETGSGPSRSGGTRPGLVP